MPTRAVNTTRNITRGFRSAMKSDTSPPLTPAVALLSTSMGDAVGMVLELTKAEPARRVHGPPCRKGSRSPRGRRRLPCGKSSLSRREKAGGLVRRPPFGQWCVSTMRSGVSNWWNGGGDGRVPPASWRRPPGIALSPLLADERVRDAGEDAGSHREDPRPHGRHVIPARIRHRIIRVRRGIGETEEVRRKRTGRSHPRTRSSAVFRSIRDHVAGHLREPVVDAREDDENGTPSEST